MERFYPIPGIRRAAEGVETGMIDNSSSGNHNETNVTVVNNVSTPNSRGAGTVLLLVFFGWFLLLWWWPILFTLWLVWLPIAGITTIFARGFFTSTWYYPWPAWMFGIR